MAGRAEEPTAAIVDSQTVKTSGNVPESSQGIDAGNYLGRLVMPGRTLLSQRQGRSARDNYRFSRKVKRPSLGR
jgi:hypothetical protein